MDTNKKSQKRILDKKPLINMNIKMPEEDYRKLQDIASMLGGMTLSSMIRMVLYAKLDEFDKTGDPSIFVIPQISKEDK